jgi:trehalose 6-phosphate phosphatase
MEKGGPPLIRNPAKQSGTSTSRRREPVEAVAAREIDALALDRYAILLDIDGTLLDLAPTPAGVLVPSSLQSTLTTLWKWSGGALALVSGRSLDDIDRIFAPLELPAIGGHGAEIRPTVADNEILRRMVPLLDERVRRGLLALAQRGVIIEDKGYSIALHYRLAPALEPELRKAVASITSDFPTGGYEVLPGKCVIEVKPTGFNKGSAVLELMDLLPFRGRRPVFVGDDVTDEAVFAILPDVDGIGFSVGRDVAGVTGVFAHPADVRDWLARLAERARDE